MCDMCDDAMCTMYWTLTGVTFTCPCCNEVNIDAELQTHFMGDEGSSLNYYKLGEQVTELDGISGTLSPIVDSDFDDMELFIGDCMHCDCWFDFGAKIKNGAVIDTWVISYDR